MLFTGSCRRDICCSPGPAATRTCPVLPARVGIPFSGGQLLDAFAPPGEARPFAIVIHGSSGNRRTHINQVLEVLEKADLAWFSVDYHGVGDVREAIRFIECPGRFNVTGRPVLIGEDTGAALALAVSRDARSVVGFGTDVREPRKIRACRCSCSMETRMKSIRWGPCVKHARLGRTVRSRQWQEGSTISKTGTPTSGPGKRI